MKTFFDYNNPVIQWSQALKKQRHNITKVFISTEYLE